MPWQIVPRLRIDLGWKDLASVLVPPADTSDLLSTLTDHAPDGTTVVVGLSVRTIFDAILETTDLSPGTVVAASAVNIGDMATLIRDRGGVIRPVDLDLNTLAPRVDALIEAARGAQLVLLTHLYGGRNPIPDLDVPLVVEDCAQAFDGTLSLSDHADVALYSFGPIKTATALGGGLAVFRDPDMAARVSGVVMGHPALSDGWFLRRAAKYAILKLISHPVIFGGLYRLVSALSDNLDARLGGAARGFSGRVSLQETIHRRPPPRLLALLARRLSAGRPDHAPVDRVLSCLARQGRLPGAAAETRGLWLCPLLTDDAQGLIAALARAGFDATRGATSLGVMSGGQTPRADRLIRDVVYVPRPSGLAEANRLVTVLDAILQPLPSTEPGGAV